MNLNSLRDFADITLKGLVATNAPKILKGMMIAFFTDYNINSIVATDLIMKNESLWAQVPEEQYYKIQRALDQIGDIDWITSEWIIDAIRADHPGLASLFLSWIKGKNWLDRQVLEIKEGVSQL